MSLRIIRWRTISVNVTYMSDQNLKNFFLYHRPKYASLVRVTNILWEKSSGRLNQFKFWKIGASRGKLPHICTSLLNTGGRILGGNCNKSLESFPPCYSESSLLTGFTPPHPPPPLSKSGLKLVFNVNIVYRNLKYENFKDYAQTSTETVRSWIRLRYRIHCCLNVLECTVQYVLYTLPNFLPSFFAQDISLGA
jgi:hypothetical protein